MLYMAVSTHGPETCPLGREDIREAAMDGARSFREIAEKHGVDVKGVWVSMAAHRTWSLCEAESAHAVEEVVVEAGMAAWNSIHIYPAASLEDTMARADEMFEG